MGAARVRDGAAQRATEGPQLLGTKGGLKSQEPPPSSAVAVRGNLWGDGQYPIILVGLSVSPPSKGGS
jgi:hypothetical protein